MVSKKKAGKMMSFSFVQGGFELVSFEPAITTTALSSALLACKALA
jgi:hypothetical protein